MKTRDLEHLSSVRDAGRSGKARQLRIDAQLSQAEIAQVVGVSAAAISLWESGRRMPRGDAALRYAAVLARLGLGQ